MIKNLFVLLNSNSSILKLNFGLLILFANLSQIPALSNILRKIYVERDFIWKHVKHFFLVFNDFIWPFENASWL